MQNEFRLKQKLDALDQVLTAIREGALLSLHEIPYDLLEEGLSLLYRREERRLACKPDIVVVVSEAKVETCFSEEQEMSYRTIDKDIHEVDDGIILAEQVDNVDEEVKTP